MDVLIRMTRINRHGLNDYIPESIKYTIRKECGFGCACCGKAVVQYHHFDPPFVDAQEHRAEGIILLCPNCHSKFGDMPVEEMREYRQSPRCRKDGFTRDDFLFRFDKVPRIKLGRVTAMSGQILRYESSVLLGLTRPEEKDGPLRLTCELVDSHNVLMLKILNNELTIGVDHFDVELTKKLLCIRRKHRDVVLQMTTNRLDEVCITHIETAIAGGTILCSPDRGLSVQAPSGGRLSVSGAIIGDIGVWITDGMCLLGGGPTTAAGAAQRWM